MNPNDRAISKELKDVSLLSETVWLSIFFASLDPVSKYYKYNLEHISFYNYLRLEKNQARKMGMSRA
jgi:hypothetical protein